MDVRLGVYMHCGWVISGLCFFFLVLFVFMFFFDKGELIVFITTDAAGVNGARKWFEPRK